MDGNWKGVYVRKAGMGRESEKRRLCKSVISLSEYKKIFNEFKRVIRTEVLFHTVCNDIVENIFTEGSWGYLVSRLTN